MDDSWQEEIRLEQRLEELAEKKEQPSWWAREGILRTRHYVEQLAEGRDPIATFEEMARTVAYHGRELALRKGAA